MISTEDIAGMRAAISESLPDTCTLVLDELTSDGAGGQTDDEQLVTSVACRVSPLRLTRSSKDAEFVVAGRELEQSLWVITMPAETTLDARYRIKSGDGRNFEVVEVLSPRSYELDVRVSCKLLNGGLG